MKGYNEIYGHLPQEVIDHLSEQDKIAAFFNWLKLEPTAAGKFISQITIKALGPDFIEYITVQVAQGFMDEEFPITKDLLAAGVQDILNLFATDTNILCGYVNDYLDEKGDDQDTINRVTEAMTMTKPGIMEKFKKTLEEEEKDSKPRRDPMTGRFVKKA